jgi:hypothetical protein
MAREFHYRLGQRAPGWRPGSHRGMSFGVGQEFIAHERLFERPDPRRLDLRASFSNVRREWLVRAARQRTSIAVHAVVDVSSSMSFPAGEDKLAMAADFLEALGHSVFRAGDAVGLLAFDQRLRTDLFLPPLRSRGAGEMMARLIKGVTGAAGDGAALAAVTERLPSRGGLIFLLSDFHWPLRNLCRALDRLADSLVVPMVMWSTPELQPPARDGLAIMRDVETGERRSLWMRPRLRARWQSATHARKEELERLMRPRGIRPFYMIDRFNSAALSRYFFELAA